MEISKKEHKRIVSPNRKSKDENPTNIGPGVTEEYEEV